MLGLVHCGKPVVEGHGLHIIHLQAHAEQQQSRVLFTEKADIRALTPFLPCEYASTTRPGALAVLHRNCWPAKQSPAHKLLCILLGCPNGKRLQIWGLHGQRLTAGLSSAQQLQTLAAASSLPRRDACSAGTSTESPCTAAVAAAMSHKRYRGRMRPAEGSPRSHPRER